MSVKALVVMQIVRHGEVDPASTLIPMMFGGRFVTHCAEWFDGSARDCRRVIAEMRAVCRANADLVTLRFAKVRPNYLEVDSWARGLGNACVQIPFPDFAEVAPRNSPSKLRRKPTPPI